MKVAVFGGSGFVGSHVADELTARGHRVKIYDLKPSPYLKKGQEWSLATYSIKKRCSGL